MSVIYFFDLPVYRVPSEKYNRERAAYVEDILFPKDAPDVEQLRAIDSADPHRNAYMRDYLQRKYGGCWRYNEVVGYIRLHFNGSQVRGEYFGIAKKRIVRTRNRTLELLSWKLAPEVEIPFPPTKDGIRSAVEEYIEDCRKALKGRFIDSSMFDRLAPHLEWEALYAARSE